MNDELVEAVALSLFNDSAAEWDALPLIHRLAWRSTARAVIPVVQAHERERCAKVMEDRAAMYVNKAAGRDPLDAETANSFDLAMHAAEASEHGAAAIRGLGE